MKYNVLHVFSMALVLFCILMIASSLFVIFSISKLNEVPKVIDEAVSFCYSEVTDFPDWSELRTRPHPYLVTRGIINIVFGVAFIKLGLRIYKKLDSINK